MGEAIWLLLLLALAAAVAFYRTIPFPGIKSRGYRANWIYNVYEIRYRYKGKMYTWKYGITSSKDPDSRPQNQYSQCRSMMQTSVCNHRWVVTHVQGWFRARAWEYFFIFNYAVRHGGYCPPGQWKSCL